MALVIKYAKSDDNRGKIADEPVEQFESRHGEATLQAIPPGKALPVPLPFAAVIVRSLLRNSAFVTELKLSVLAGVPWLL